jgi:hypothetical protein
MMYYYIDDVVIEEAEICYGCPPSGTVTTWTEPADGDGCCYDLFVKNHLTCDRYTDGLLVSSATPFTWTDGDWTGTSNFSGVRFETTGMDLLPAGQPIHLGTFCFEASPDDIVIGVAPYTYYNSNGESMWCNPLSTEVECSCCDAFSLAALQSAEDMCEWELRVSEIAANQCDIYGISILTVMAGGNVLSNPTGTAGSSPIDFTNPVTIGTISVDAGTFGSVTFTVLFLDANGDVICSKSISRNCPGGLGSAGGTPEEMTYIPR